MKAQGTIACVLAAALAACLPAFAMAQASSPTLEQRLQRVEDELAIRRVLVDYAATQDARDYAGYAALFAQDGEWVNGKTVHKGREAIHKMLVDLYGAPPPGFVNSESFHITSNAEIDVNGDRATARSRHLLVMRGPKASRRRRWPAAMRMNSSARMANGRSCVASTFRSCRHPKNG